MGARKKILLTSGILVILTLVFIYFGAYSLFKEIKRNSEEFIKAKKELVLLETKIKNLEQFKKNYGDLELDLAKTDELFINSKIPIDFIKFLEKTATDSEVSIGISLSSEVRADNPWPSLEFQLSFSGSLPKVLKFVERIETAPYLIVVQNFSATKSDKGSNVSGILSIKIFAK